MSFDEIFQAYYTLFRAESEIPESTDEEYIVALRMANEAINRWAFYDNTYWKTLFNTLQVSGDGDSTMLTGITEYDCPQDFQEGGGFIKVKDSSGNTLQTYPILEPQEVQFRNDAGTYAYFTGDPANGFVLNLNPSPDASLNGNDIDYVYYKQPTLFTTGTDVSEIPDPYFIVNRMLGQQFRASRNPYYQSAKNDAENALKQMKMSNDSGSWANPWKLTDNSGSTWGS
jgi:hypothetical protein